MYEHILIATDGSESGTKALEHGLSLAKCDGARVTVVTVTEPWSPFDMAREARERKPDPVGQFEAVAAAVAKHVLEDAAQKAEALGVLCDFVHVTDRHPADGIISTANQRGCDLIVTGSRGRRGMSRLLLGSQAYEVLTHCRVPALIVR
jgi:nucleotide-binding universal stress UspA family protein